MLVRIGEIADFQKGYPFKTKDYVKRGCKVIRVTNLNSNDYRDNSLLFIEKTKYQQYEKYSLRKDDIVISTVGSWPTHPSSVVGKVTIIPEHIEGALLNQNAVRIRAKGKCIQEYLIYTLLHKDFKEYIIGRACGSASQASIKIDDIKNYKISLPDIEVQREKTELLCLIDRKIYLNEMMNKKLEEVRDLLITKEFE